MVLEAISDPVAETEGQEVNLVVEEVYEPTKKDKKRWGTRRKRDATSPTNSTVLIRSVPLTSAESTPVDVDTFMPEKEWEARTEEESPSDDLKSSAPPENEVEGNDEKDDGRRKPLVSIRSHMGITDIHVVQLDLEPTDTFSATSDEVKTECHTTKGVDPANAVGLPLSPTREKEQELGDADSPETQSSVKSKEERVSAEVALEIPQEQADLRNEPDVPVSTDDNVPNLVPAADTTTPTASKDEGQAQGQTESWVSAGDEEEMEGYEVEVQVEDLSVEKSCEKRNKWSLRSRQTMLERRKSVIRNMPPVYLKNGSSTEYTKDQPTMSVAQPPDGTPSLATSRTASSQEDTSKPKQEKEAEREFPKRTVKASAPTAEEPSIEEAEKPKSVTSSPSQTDQEPVSSVLISVTSNPATPPAEPVYSPSIQPEQDLDMNAQESQESDSSAVPPEKGLDTNTQEEIHEKDSSAVPPENDLETNTEEIRKNDSLAFPPQGDLEKNGEEQIRENDSLTVPSVDELESCAEEELHEIIYGDDDEEYSSRALAASDADDWTIEEGYELELGNEPLSRSNGRKKRWNFRSLQHKSEKQKARVEGPPNCHSVGSDDKSISSASRLLRGARRRSILNHGFDGGDEKSSVARLLRGSRRMSLLNKSRGTQAETKEINGFNLAGLEDSCLTIKAVAVKENKGSNKMPNGTLVVSGVSKSGFFSQTDLKVGDELVCLNGTGGDKKTLKSIKRLADEEGVHVLVFSPRKMRSRGGSRVSKASRSRSGLFLPDVIDTMKAPFMSYDMDDSTAITAASGDSSIESAQYKPNWYDVLAEDLCLPFCCIDHRTDGRKLITNLCADEESTVLTMEDTVETR